MTDTTIEDDDDRALTMVDEALVAGEYRQYQRPVGDSRQAGRQGTIFDADDLHAFSVQLFQAARVTKNMRENELISQMQDQMEATLAQLMHYLSDKGS